jgi:hypothetical protein
MKTDNSGFGDRNWKIQEFRDSGVDGLGDWVKDLIFEN